MIRDWFNAREAVEVGTSLADYFSPSTPPAAQGATRRSGRSGNDRTDLQTFLKRAAKEVRPLKLNLFKRAKLLNSFKWKLLEHGFDRRAVDELTELLLLQISGAPPNIPILSDPISSKSPEKASRKRLPGLLAEADARFAAREYAKAVECLQQALEVDPRHAIAHAKLGATHYYLGRFQEAEKEFRRAIELKVPGADAHLNLGALLYIRGDFSGSETALRRAVKRDPNNPEALVSLGLTVALNDQLPFAKDCFEKALRLKPRNASALCALGWMASIDGRFDEAEKLYRDALDTDPLKAAAWASLPTLRRMTAEDKGWLEGVERTLASGVPGVEESRLRFAMGKYFDDLGNFSRAFEQYKRGNELYKLVAAPYAREERTKFVDDMIRAYTKQRLAHPLEGVAESAKPVFVTGMMRSGTSLVEQIIASHPKAAGAGELDFWGNAARQHERIVRYEVPNSALAGRLADAYLQTLSRYSAEALRVVDKSTFNSDHLGLIHMALPKARIIYLRRDPVDTCLSCYFQNFANVANFTMDLSDLAHYYREHHRLIAHWRATLPASVLLEVPYAELVADPEAWSRRIIEFIGLEWDPRCLEFQQTKRAVLTASHWQVRQRVYSRSVGRWRNYTKYIGPLLELRDLAS